MRTFLKTTLTVKFLSLMITGLSLTTQSNDPIAKAFGDLPENEKESFLSYFLGLSLVDWANDQLRPPKSLPGSQVDALISSLNISDVEIHKFQEMNIPKESRKKLLEWVKSKFSLVNMDVLLLIKTKKCQGHPCIALPDIGEICCPW